MFERFVESFSLSPTEQVAGAMWRDDRLIHARGYLELAGRFAGCSFNDGLYRLHDAASGPRGMIREIDQRLRSLRQFGRSRCHWTGARKVSCSPQQAFDNQVSPENPATARLNGQTIKITGTYLAKVP